MSYLLIDEAGNVKMVLGSKKRSETCSTNEEATSFRKHLKKVLLQREMVHNSRRKQHEEKSEKHKNLYELVKRAIECGESNSVLLIGPRGCGKTMLLEGVFSDIGSSVLSTCAVLIRLNGLLHTDDRLALQDMAKQMKLEKAVGDRVFGSFAENLAYLLASLKSKDDNTLRPIIVVLEEFDLFCSHRNQTLLYNLFDVAQSAQAPLCVIGLTCRLDVTELLEKRVKSRFSHRQVYLFHDASFAEYTELASSLLLSPCLQFPASSPFGRLWTENIKDLMDNSTTQDVLRRLYSSDRSRQKLKKFLFLVACTLNEDHHFIMPEDVQTVFETFTIDAKTELLIGLSVLELTLVIAMRRLTVVHDGDPFNFELLVREYSKFVKQSSFQSCSKPVLQKAFEYIQSLELVGRVEGHSSNQQKEFLLFKLYVTASQIDEALKRYKGLPTDVAQWATSNIL